MPSSSNDSGGRGGKAGEAEGRGGKSAKRRRRKSTRRRRKRRKGRRRCRTRARVVRGVRGMGSGGLRWGSFPIVPGSRFEARISSLIQPWLSRVPRPMAEIQQLHVVIIVPRSRTPILSIVGERGNTCIGVNSSPTECPNAFSSGLAPSPPHPLLFSREPRMTKQGWAIMGNRENAQTINIKTLIILASEGALDSLACGI
eukprot:9473846-Pyramimonas_sp.AAC.1